MRPRIRLPLWAAAAIPVAAYAIRSVMRGDASPDLPGDLIVIMLVAVALLLGWRYGSAAHRGGDNLSEQVEAGRQNSGAGGQDDEVR